MRACILHLDFGQLVAMASEFEELAMHQGKVKAGVLRLSLEEENNKKGNVYHLEMLELMKVQHL